EAGFPSLGTSSHGRRASAAPARSRKHTRPAAVRRGPFAVDTIPDMERAAAPARADETRVSPPRVRVRYWAAAKAAAGVAEDTVTGGTVADVLAAAAELHRAEPRFDKVLSVCSFLLGES